jgi:small subunit ribosomal protein S3
MGQKINPIGLRLGVIRDWTARWYAGNKNYASNLAADIKLRGHIKAKLSHAALSKIIIERPAQNISITLFTARPASLSARRARTSRSRQELTRLAGHPVHVAIEEVRKPEIDAQLVAESIAQQLEKRIMFRRAMKRAVQNALRLGALGVKVMVAGRLNGAEIARTEWYREGRVPLHTLRADIDYGTAEAYTTYGVIGVKVWIFKGEVFDAAEAGQTEPAKKAIA